MESHDCQRCGHSWTTKSDRVPVRCPKCGSRDWQNAVTDASASMEAETDAVREAILGEYRNGKGCLEISMATGVPYSTVRGMIEDDGTQIRL